MKTGVLALQGSYFDHVKSLELIDKDYTLIKSAKDLDNIDSLILPGGESTAMMKIQKDDNLFEKIKIKINDGMPTLGTCAGLILLAKDIIDGESSIACLNTVVERNAYGRQNESFEGLVEFNDNKEMYCFIRAPKIISYGNSVNPIASIDDEIVGIHENNIVGLSFHPELTNHNVYLKWL